LGDRSWPTTWGASHRAKLARARARARACESVQQRAKSERERVRAPKLPQQPVPFLWFSWMRISNKKEDPLNQIPVLVNRMLCSRGKVDS
jgi:hypothetical protein